MLFSSISVCAQVIPNGKSVDWSCAGYQGEKPNPTVQIDVSDYGAIGDSLTDNYQAIMDAIQALNGQMGVIYFPPGVYLVNSTILLPDSVIIRGATADSTNMAFNMGGQGVNCINISREQNTSFTKIDSGYSKGSSDIYLQSAGSFTIGSFAEIREENGDWDTEPVSWAEYSVGQIVRITDVSSNKLSFKNPLRIDYEVDLHPEIRPVQPINNVGIECLKITRVDNALLGSGYNIFFNFAVQCWVEGVESDKSVGSHINVATSSQIDIKSCYLHHAFTYDGAGTRGYGITLSSHSGECKIENNILKHLRHALMVKTGANGNVFGYNYSIEPYRSEIIHDFSGDISLHGHYAFSNLFEGNIVQNIIIDHYWGPSGPFNTFFRNRAELYGIIMTVTDTIETNSQNFVGNEVTNTNILYGNYTLTGLDHFEFGNNIKGTIIPKGTTTLPDESYYLIDTPSFWNIPYMWPSIGIPTQINTGTIPAKQRFLFGGAYTICREIDTTTYIDSKFEKLILQISPNPFKDYIFIRNPYYMEGMISYQILTLYGQKICSGRININGNTECKIILKDTLPSGIYLLILSNGTEKISHRIVKH